MNDHQQRRYGLQIKILCGPLQTTFAKPWLKEQGVIFSCNKKSGRGGFQGWFGDRNTQGTALVSLLFSQSYPHGHSMAATTPSITLEEEITESLGRRNSPITCFRLFREETVSESPRSCPEQGRKEG